MRFFLRNISIHPIKLFFDQLQQKFFSFTHSVLTKHIIIKIVSLSHPEMEMGIKLKICFKTRDGNRKTVYARLFVPTVHSSYDRILRSFLFGKLVLVPCQVSGISFAWRPFHARSHQRTQSLQHSLH